MLPVIPLLLYNPGNMNMFHRFMKEYKTPIVIVVVSYPACAHDHSCALLHERGPHEGGYRHHAAGVAYDEIGDVLDLKHGLSKQEK
ncbi:hypothetical protein K438DRAFT_1961886 [Mycena galopus ATCC 62051]|nr:hypothetical protein K438DRAFT_1961886 [Mycena galopus ATCC 62051]